MCVAGGSVNDVLEERAGDSSEETQRGRVRNYAAEESHVKVQYCENLRPVGENEKESNDNLGRSAGLMN